MKPHPKSTLAALAVIVLLMTGIGCGSSGGGGGSSPSPSPTTPTTPTNKKPPTGTAGGTTTGTDTTGNLAFSDVAPVIANNCGGGGCHDTGSRRVTYVDRQDNVDQNKSRIASLVNGGSMPPGGMSPADKELLLQYCSQ